MYKYIECFAQVVLIALCNNISCLEKCQRLLKYARFQFRQSLTNLLH